MVGRAVSLDIPRLDAAEAEADALTVRGLVAVGKSGKRLLDDVTLSVRAGEIHGIAGIAGSGQKELCEAIAGLLRVKAGSIRLNGREISGMTARALSRGKVKIGFVPEDRMRMGLAGALSISDNVLLRSLGETRGIFLDGKKNELRARGIIGKYEISAAGPASR
jgi:simple sugar transport system ATP-binding protein